MLVIEGGAGKAKLGPKDFDLTRFSNQGEK
jgi:hypothetical protein